MIEILYSVMVLTLAFVQCVCFSSVRGKDPQPCLDINSDNGTDLMHIISPFVGVFIFVLGFFFFPFI